MSGFTGDQVRRYSRHVLLPDVGGAGQSRLLAATAVVDGSGAAGRVAAMYLVAAGVGTVIVDGALATPVHEARFPLVAGDTGRALGDALAAALGGHNPDVRVVLGGAAAGAVRVTIEDDADDLAMAEAFERGGAAAAMTVHRIAVGATP